MAENTQDLRSQLQQEIIGASKSVAEAESRLGAQTPNFQPAFRERGYRLGDRIIARAELNTAMATQAQAVDDLMKSSGFTDERQSFLFQDTLNRRLNNMRLDLVKKGLEFDRRLEEFKVSREKRAQAAKNFGAIAGMTVGAIYGGAGGAMVGGQVGSQLGGSMAQY